MEELGVLLGELPKEEREEAIRYYDAYFEDAGAENEQAVIAELGSAGRVAAQILKDFRAERESGVYTEQGYQEAEEKKETPVRYEEKNTDSNSHREATTDGSGIHIQKKGMSGTTLVLLLIVAVFAFPVWFPLLMAVLGVLFGIGAALVGMVFGFGVAGVACAVAGVITFFMGFVKLVAVPIVGLVFLAIALLVFGLGCLLLVVAGACAKLLVFLAGKLLNACSRLFHGRREATV